MSGKFHPWGKHGRFIRKKVKICRKCIKCQKSFHLIPSLQNRGRTLKTNRVTRISEQSTVVVWGRGD
jgi:hypothetical protein